jgi:hypothetical protein
VTHWAGIEDLYQHEDKETFDQAKDEDKKKLGCETFQIEPSLEKLGHIEDEGSRKSIEAETISRKEVHEKSHEEG